MTGLPHRGDRAEKYPPGLARRARADRNLGYEFRRTGKEGHDRLRLPRLARADPPAELLAAVHTRRAGRLRRRHVAPTTSPRGAPGRASPAFAWSWLGAALQATSCPSAWSTRPASATTRRSSRRRSAPSARCTRAGSGPRWAPARPATSTSPATGGRARTSAAPGCASAWTSSGRCCAGEEVSHDGLVRVDRARLWTRPAEPPPLIGAAVSVATARWCAEWADGLITVNAPSRAPAPDDRRLPGRRRARAAAPAGAPELGARAGRGRGDRARPVAQQRLRRRRSAGTSTRAEHFDAVSADVPLRPGAPVPCTSRPTWAGTPAGWRSTSELGFDQIALHHVGQEQHAFIDAFGAKVLPQLRSAQPTGSAR